MQSIKTNNKKNKKRERYIFINKILAILFYIYSNLVINKANSKSREESNIYKGLDSLTPLMIIC
jgi:hypothetical protein